MADGEGNTPLVLCAKSNHVQAKPFFFFFLDLRPSREGDMAVG